MFVIIALCSWVNAATLDDATVVEPQPHVVGAPLSPLAAEAPRLGLW